MDLRMLGDMGDHNKIVCGGSNFTWTSPGKIISCTYKYFEFGIEDNNIGPKCQWEVEPTHCLCFLIVQSSEMQHYITMEQEALAMVYALHTNSFITF